jgi:hypothetical protein
LHEFAHANQTNKRFGKDNSAREEGKKALAKGVARGGWKNADMDK